MNYLYIYLYIIIYNIIYICGKQEMREAAKRLPKINRHVILSALYLQFNEKQYLAHDP